MVDGYVKVPLAKRIGIMGHVVKVGDEFLYDSKLLIFFKIEMISQFRR